MVCPGCQSGDIDYSDMRCVFCGRLAKEAERQAFLSSLPAKFREIQEERFEMALREGGG
jgi:hypothetical protein